MTPEERAALRDQLEDHEGMRLRVYPDMYGISTIGVGRNLRDKGISRAEALLLLDDDLTECETDLLTFEWFADLDAIRRRALIDLRFNLGPVSFRHFVKMLTALSSKRYEDAAAELQSSTWASQVQPNRVTDLVRMIRTGQL